MVSIIAIICALAIERWTQIAAWIRKWRIFQFYQRLMLNLLDKIGIKNSSIHAIAMLVLAVIAVSAIEFILTLLQRYLNLYGLFTFVFTLVVLLYTLGSHLYGSPEERAMDDSVEGCCARANNYVYAVIFWMALLGPTGAVLYRLSEQLYDQPLSPDWQTGGAVWLKLLNWLPLRFVGLGFAFVGNFNAAITIWLDHFIGGLDSSLVLATNCAQAVLKALGDKTTETDTVSSSVGGAALYRLFDRVIILWLVVMVFIALI